MRMYFFAGAASEVDVSKERLCGRVLHVQLHRKGHRPRHALVVQGSLPQKGKIWPKMKEFRISLSEIDQKWLQANRVLPVDQWIGSALSTLLYHFKDTVLDFCSNLFRTDTRR